MNYSDSERLASFLDSKNLKPASEIKLADLVIINTCGIRKAAEDRVYSTIHNLRKIEGKEIKIVMTGCIAKRPDVQKRMRNKVDLFCSIADFPNNIQLFFDKILDIKYQTASNSLSRENIDYLSLNPKHTSSFQANVPIMTGCDNFCSYCVVPYARGRETSRSAEEILEEISALVAKGYKHITLLGQNVNSYISHVQENTNKIDFPKLLKLINKIPGKFWISFVSSHPKDMSDDLIKTVTRLKKVCEWIHLPIQAGNDEVLARMNRRYTQKHYLKLIKKIKVSFEKNKPGIPFSISSDIIVGFPSETSSQFADSALVMQKAGFDMVYFGQFSPRPGTAAWKMRDDVSAAEKERREFVLNEILKKTSLANNKKYIGKKIEILIEKEKDGFYFGKTRTQKNVKILSKKRMLIGGFAKVKITKANNWNLEGELT